MNEQIKRITSDTDKPEIKIEKSVSINYDGRQYFIRIPKKISDFLKITDKNKIKFILDVSYIKDTNNKIMVVEIIGKKE